MFTNFTTTIALVLFLLLLILICCGEFLIEFYQNNIQKMRIGSIIMYQCPFSADHLCEYDGEIGIIVEKYWDSIFKVEFQDGKEWVISKRNLHYIGRL